MRVKISAYRKNGKLVRSEHIVLADVYYAKLDSYNIIIPAIQANCSPNFRGAFQCSEYILIQGLSEERLYNRMECKW